MKPKHFVSVGSSIILAKHSRSKISDTYTRRHYTVPSESIGTLDNYFAFDIFIFTSFGYDSYNTKCIAQTKICCILHETVQELFASVVHQK